MFTAMTNNKNSGLKIKFLIKEPTGNKFKHFSCQLIVFGCSSIGDQSVAISSPEINSDFAHFSYMYNP